MIKKIRSVALLDTHIWIWLVTNDPRVQAAAFLKKIKAFESHQGLRISIISIWEIGMLQAKGRIELPFSVQQWVQKALNVPGILITELTPEIAIESTHLPGEFHGDPADRIILATTKSLGGTLVTADREMLKYSKEHHLETLSP